MENAYNETMKYFLAKINLSFNSLSTSIMKKINRNTELQDYLAQ